MKIQTTRSVDNQLGDLESHRVTIEASGKAFATLVRGIYEDKIAAFVREISTNALDAHTQAGYPERPFKVDLPDSIDPYYRVRDFGVSMDHETVFTVFGTLFRSTKDESNEAVGAFGIGSKSPLAYADSFEVTAWLDGQRRSYLCTLDADGTPVLTLLSTVESDEPQGLEVAVPVRERDFHLVLDAARNILPGFDVMPEVVGADIEPFKVVETINEDEVWLIAKPEGSFYRGMNVRVRMGCVLYPVSLEALGTDYEERRSLHIGNVDLILNVPIGSVGITTNREALELTPETKDMLKGMVLRANEALRCKVESKFDECENRLEAVRKFVEDGTDDYWSGPIEFRGKKLNEWLFLGEYKKTSDEANREIVPFVRKETRREAVPMTQLRYQNVSACRFVYGNKKQIKRATLRYRDYVDTNKYWHDVFWLTNPSPRVIERMIRVAGFNREQFVWVGSLEDPGPAKRGERRAKGTPQGVRQFDPQGQGRMGYSYPNECESFPEAYYWIEGTRIQNYQCETAWEKVTVIVKNGGDELPLLIFTPSAARRYKPAEDRQVSKALALVLESKKADVREAYRKQVLWNWLPGVVDQMFMPQSELNTELANLAESVLTADEAQEIRAEVQIEIDDLKATYPMLFNPSVQVMEAYIAQVDKANET